MSRRYCTLIYTVCVLSGIILGGFGVLFYMGGQVGGFSAFGIARVTGIDVSEGDISNVGDIELTTISADNGSFFSTIYGLQSTAYISSTGGTSVYGDPIELMASNDALITATNDIILDADGDLSLEVNNEAAGIFLQGATGDVGISGSGDVTLSPDDDVVLSPSDDIWAIVDVFEVIGDVNTTGYVSVGTFSNLSVQAEISVTNGSVFTPTGSYQWIAAASEVTPTISTSGFEAGDLLELENREASIINFEDTGNQVLAGNCALGLYDVLVVRFDGTRWIARACSNN